MDQDQPVGGVCRGRDGSVPATHPDIAEPYLLRPEPGLSLPPQSFASKVPPVSPSSPDPHASSLMVVDHAPLKRQAMRGNFRAPEQVAPEEAQWRTGKAPGYQGLTQKRKAESSSDHENESHDMGVSAARILKRPFKPPTIVKLPTAPKVRLKPTQAAAPINKPRIGPTRRLGTTLRAKPFIPPSLAADGLSSQSRLNTSRRTSRNGKSSAMDLNKPLIASLENRLLTIRKAINLDQSNNDSVVEGRVHTWRHAGREVADMLFALLPQPSEDCESRLTSSRWDDWGYGNDHHSDRLTPVQLEYLRNAPTDANGDILDEAGDRVFGGNDDIRSFIDQALSLDHYTPATERYRDDCDPVPKTEYGVWDKGAMLLRLRVDPDLLGWDRETEDWMGMGE
ncbi:hypothetical protein CspHIS471_0504500 [Cutaneotrichosporon sp. HIS471]|nr:hypothetical protein CspHIS471_0504500 [Cutaneotrichosporon sp. HIS471]